MQICVCVFSARWWNIMPWGARFPTEIEQGFFSGFPQIHSGMFVILCNTIFNYCNFNIYVCIYIHMWSVYPNIFSVTFMPKNRNFNHSIWLILYSKPLDLKCVKWIKSMLCCDCYTKIKLIYSFTVLNYGPKRLVSPAALRMPEPFMRSIYANITFWRQISQRLKGNQMETAETTQHEQWFVSIRKWIRKLQDPEPGWQLSSA